jgi:hypothetical protein
MIRQKTDERLNRSLEPPTTPEPCRPRGGHGPRILVDRGRTQNDGPSGYISAGNRGQ